MPVRKRVHEQRNRRFQGIMKQQMKAAVVVRFGEPLELRECEIPAPGPGPILVKTEACGVCHTDVHAAEGDRPMKPTLPPGEFPTPLFDVVANCITIRGSFVGSRQDMAEALAFAAEGKVKADVELQPLSAINQILDRLEYGKVASRVVVDFALG